MEHTIRWGKRITGLLLAAALVIGLIPGTQLTAEASGGYEAVLLDADLGTTIEGYNWRDFHSSLNMNKTGTENLNSEEEYMKVELTAGDTEAFFLVYKGGGIIVEPGETLIAHVYPAEDLSAGSYRATATLYYDRDGEETAYTWEALASSSVTFTVNEPGTMYNITVENGTADKLQACEGQIVNIEATPPEGEVFSEWEVVSGDVTIPQYYQWYASFVMPASDVYIRAVTIYELYAAELRDTDIGIVEVGYDYDDYFTEVIMDNTGTASLYADELQIDLVAGDTEAFSCYMEGGGNIPGKSDGYRIAYVWPAADLPAGTYSAMMSLSYDRDGDGTDYDREVLGTATVTFEVREEYGAAEIITHPQYVYAGVGDLVYFKVVARNAAAYQWQYSRNNGKTWFNTNAQGHDTERLRVRVTESNLGFYWRCVVSGLDGVDVESGWADIRRPDIVFTKQPADVAAKVGDTVTFSVTAKYAETYQWQYSSDNGATWKNTKVPGYDTTTISVTLNSSGYYNYWWRCKATDAYGDSVCSNSAKALRPQGAVITQQPQNVEADVLDTVQFSVTAQNATKYKWQYSKDGTTWKNTSALGYKTNTITVTLNSEGWYRYYWRCAVTGQDGKVVYSHVASAIPFFADITIQPEDAYGMVGDTVEFSIAADHAKSYKWQYSSDGATWKSTKIEGYNTDTISVHLKSAGWFRYHWRCVVTGYDGMDVISDEAVAIEDGHP